VRNNAFRYCVQSAGQQDLVTSQSNSAMSCSRRSALRGRLSLSSALRQADRAREWQLVKRRWLAGPCVLEELLDLFFFHFRAGRHVEAAHASRATSSWAFNGDPR